MLEVNASGEVRLIGFYEQDHPEGEYRENRRHEEPKLLRQGLNGPGYPCVRVVHFGKERQAPVHQLVCWVFHGPRSGDQIVRHLDDNKLNNTPSNLAYGTCADNYQDAVSNGRIRTVFPLPRYSDRDILDMVWAFDQGACLEYLESVYRIPTPVIIRILKGKSYKRLNCARPKEINEWLASCKRRKAAHARSAIGDRRRRSRYTKEQILEAISARWAGATWAEILEQTGVPSGIIYAIRNGKAHHPLRARVLELLPF